MKKNILPIVKKKSDTPYQKSAFTNRLEKENPVDHRKADLDYYIKINSQRYYDTLNSNERFDFPYNYIQKAKNRINIDELLNYFKITRENYLKYIEMKNEK